MSAVAAGQRCDRCPAAAVAEITLLAGPLFLCGHHVRKHADALESQAIGVSVLAGAEAGAWA